MIEQKILKKFFLILNKNTKSSINFNNYNDLFNDLTTLEKQIIEKFKLIYFIKQNQTKIFFYFHKKFDVNYYNQQVDNFLNYLKEYNVLTTLIKKYNNKNYGVLITNINLLLEKVK